MIGCGEGGCVLTSYHGLGGRVRFRVSIGFRVGLGIRSSLGSEKG